METAAMRTVVVVVDLYNVCMYGEEWTMKTAITRRGHSDRPVVLL